MQNRSARKGRKKTGLIGGIFFLFLIVAGTSLFLFLLPRWSTPLGPSLQLPTYTPTIQTITATPEISATVENTADNPGETASFNQPTQTALIPSPTPEPLCSGPAEMVVLGIGADNEYGYRYGLADAMRVARVDFVNAKVTVLSVPRDFWVEIPGIEDHYGITHGKLNQAYFYGNPGMGYYDGPGEGPGLLARTLDLNFGLRVDHYGAVNMNTFAKIVDAVGGIEIYLPHDVDGRPIDDRTEDMGYFYAGQQHFNGDEALRFSRIRKKYNDLTRMDNQNLVLCSLRDKLLKPSVLPKIPQIIAAFEGAVMTDLSLEQLSQLACLLPHMKSENLIFASFPDDMLKPSRVYSEALKSEVFILDVDNTELRRYVEMFLEGSWPIASESGGSTCP